METYDLHDSIVEQIEYLHDEKKVQLKLELCQWRKKHDTTETEIQEGIMTFSVVELLQIEPPSFLINSNEILEVRINAEDGSIEFILMGSHDVGKVKILSQDVTWEGR
ncbi:hypothetical protein M3194_30535 [Paenibacillus glycanilyticus]|uniref:hypothetical protein n=1 Tax=Paenibacillus glycanilyticus TaxID=126569 RepID=UPI002040558C|nr:hypothetical protein [Paenibacillus glycanilyticus]MCM3631634.1 hypothetical protein [Paenibacillus glycanilyticus]